MNPPNQLDICRVLPQESPYTGLLRVQALNNPVVTICSPAFWVVKCHWVKNRSYAHLKDHEKCVGCKREWPLKRRALVLVVHGPKRKQEFLDLTVDGALEVQELAPNPDNLRGVKLHCGRIGRTTRGRFVFEVVGFESDTLALPQDESPEASCLRLWGEAPELCGQVDVT